MSSVESLIHMSEIYETEQEGAGSCRKMKRFRLTHNQSRYLMSEFARQAHPDAAHRERLSREIPGLSPRQVQVWFQNRRAKLKRMSSDDRYHMMKSRALPEEFPILQTLYSYDLAGASKVRAARSDSSCSSASDQTRDISSASPRDSDQASHRFSVSSECYIRDYQSDSSARSCQVSPISPCSATPRELFGRRTDGAFRPGQDSFSSSGTAPISGPQQHQQQQQQQQQQPLGSYYEQISTYRASAYMFPNCSVSDCRSAKSGAGEIWPARDDVQSLQVYPNWRPTLDTSFRNDSRHESISPQSSCSSATSEEYIPENIASHRFDNHHRTSQVFDYSTAPRLVSLPLPTDSVLNMYDTQERAMETKGQQSKRSLSQPNVDLRS